MSIYRRFTMFFLVCLTSIPKPSFGLSIVLLTHINEMVRPTNTGRLLRSSLMTTDSLQLWQWSGSNDNERISQAIEASKQPLLIWTEAPIIDSSTNTLSCDNTYIILDGTWQEAQKMFRRGPEVLRKIPRISLKPSFSSKYRLRSNFGFIKRFGNKSNSQVNPAGEAVDNNLLCTAEVGAALLLLHGDESGAQIVLNNLETFQTAYTGG